MPASWELRQNSQVLCAILHVDTCTIAWAFGLRNLDLPGPITGLAGMPFDMARNQACKAALVGGFEYIFFLDSDVIPPRDAVRRLLAHRKPIISGVYHRRSPPAGVPVMIRGGNWITQYPPNAVIKVDLVGAGCLLIHRSVLEALPPSDAARGKTHFDWKVDMQGIGPPGDCLSEDFVFCRNAKEKLGVDVLVDTSVICRHVGLAQAGFGSFVPCEATPVT